jgi:hypothetical protein
VFFKKFCIPSEVKTHFRGHPNQRFSDEVFKNSIEKPLSRMVY